MPAPNPTFVYRITHADNVPWLLANGLHCASAGVRDPGFVEIGLPDLIQRRATRTVPLPPGGTLNDYVPFYFGTHSVMLYNLHTGYGVKQVPQREIVYLVSSVQLLGSRNVPFLFTNRHAYVALAHYSSNTADLDTLDWDLINGRDFKRDPNRPEKIERREAELLAHRSVPFEALEGIACYDGTVRLRIEAVARELGVNVTVRENREWYF
ncbi:MAG: type II toxin-antitoxin system toxin DNA ADP-ribosyl transferase DarT [Burkholderiales bacterium]